MSKKEIDMIFKKISEKKNSNSKKKSRIVEELFGKFVTKDEYEEAKEEIDKLKEKYLKIESTIKEEIKGKINEISFEDFMDYINKLKNISTIEVSFKINNENKKNIEFEELIQLYFKIKHIILIKGESTCYTLFAKELIFFFASFDIYIEFLRESIIETKELTDFMFKNVFRVGEGEKYEYLEQKLKKKYLRFSQVGTKIDKYLENIKNVEMRKPKSYIEKIISIIMKIQNIEDKSKISINILNIIKTFEDNINSFDDFEKGFFKIILMPVIKELNNEIMIDKRIYNDINGINLDIEPKNRLCFFKGENIGKDEDLYTEYKNYKYLDKLDKSDEIYPILQKTICSFLNTKGGRIYIGIDDDLEVIGYYIRNKHEKKVIKTNLINLVSGFFPKVEDDKIKIHFIPIINYQEGSYYKNFYVIKIIVAQGNIHELYSIEKNFYSSFIRLPGLVRELKCEDIKDEIIKRMTSEEKPIDPKEYDDIEPQDPDGLFDFD